MIQYFFTTNASASYGARIFLHAPIGLDAEFSELRHLHDLAKCLCIWHGHDKSVTIPEQIVEVQEIPATNNMFVIKNDGNRIHESLLLGYEVEPEELAVLVKRCNQRCEMIDVTEYIKDMIKTVWN